MKRWKVILTTRYTNDEGQTMMEVDAETAFKALSCIKELASHFCSNPTNVEIQELKNPMDMLITDLRSHKLETVDILIDWIRAHYLGEEL